MGAKNRQELARDLARGQARFRAWRAERKLGEHIPRQLWALAVRMARLHGLNRTSLAFGLDRRYLQRRIAATDVSAQAPTNSPVFVELPRANLARKECHLKLDNGTGAIMRVQLIDYDAGDLEVLSRGFWNAQ